MAYKVISSTRAEQDLFEYVALILERESSKEPARKWLAEMRRIMRSLREDPTIYVTIPEVFENSNQFRELHQFAHRIIYTVDENTKTVHVHRIYHGNRRPLRSSDL